MFFSGNARTKYGVALHQCDARWKNAGKMQFVLNRLAREVFQNKSHLASTLSQSITKIMSAGLAILRKALNHHPC
jgi:hypothetical protein